MTAEELNREVMKQLLLDAISEQVEKEYNNNPPKQPKIDTKKEQVNTDTKTKPEENEDTTQTKSVEKPKESETQKNIKSETQEKKKSKKKVKGKSKKKETLLDKLVKTEKVKTVLVLILALLVNTFAWFIYVSTVSTGLSMHVRNWLFEFSESEENIIIHIDRVYPGMQTYTKEITGSNIGEMTADLSVHMKQVRILDDEFMVGQTYTKPDHTTGTYTSEDLIDIMQNNYPFKIKIYIDGVLYDGADMILSTGDSKVVTYEVSWPYESTTDPDQLAAYDAIDTQYGNDAYTYYNTHRTDTDPTTRDCIYVKLVMEAVQAEGQPDDSP